MNKALPLEGLMINIKQCKKTKALLLQPHLKISAGCQPGLTGSHYDFSRSVTGDWSLSWAIYYFRLDQLLE